MRMTLTIYHIGVLLPMPGRQ